MIAYFIEDDGAFHFEDDTWQLQMKPKICVTIRMHLLKHTKEVGTNGKLYGNGKFKKKG